MKLLPWGLIILKGYCIHTVYIFSRNYEEILLAFFFFSKIETLILRPSRFSCLKPAYNEKGDYAKDFS